MCMEFIMKWVVMPHRLCSFVTDSTKHFSAQLTLFYNTPNADSIAPVVNFIKPDIIKLISTLKWEEPVP